MSASAASCTGTLARMNFTSRLVVAGQNAAASHRPNRRPDARRGPALYAMTRPYAVAPAGAMQQAPGPKV
jgi:hypothetical protein